MHGLMLAELRRYVDGAAGADTWPRVCIEAGVDRALHRESEHYPTAELIALVEAAARVTGTAVPTLLEAFGAFLAPRLLARYRYFTRPEWTALDLLEQAEHQFHRVVRLTDAVAHPPRLAVTRVSPSEVLITYTSYRRLCHLARGIARGVLAQYGEHGMVRETGCMHHGDQACLIVVSTQAA